MGASGSAVSQRIEQAGKTGVCSLSDMKLEQVSLSKRTRLHCSYRGLSSAVWGLGGLSNPLPPKLPPMLEA